MYGFAGGDPVNYADPFGLCLPGCAGAVAEQLHALAPTLKAGLEIAAVVTLAPAATVVGGEALAASGVGAAAGAIGRIASSTVGGANAVLLEVGVEATRSSTASLIAGTVEGFGRSLVADHGNRALPSAAGAPNKAWAAGRALGTALYFGAKVTLAHYGVQF